jgi:predicted GIY-YIG superfamily endonuclease
MKRTVATDSQNSVYRLYDSSDRLLYVGLSCDVARRLQQHKKTKSWWSDVALIKIKVFDDSEVMKIAEQEAIRLESPLHNSVRFRHDYRILPSGHKVKIKARAR